MIDIGALTEVEVLAVIDELDQMTSELKEGKDENTEFH